jgi:hypothetical protein
LYEIPSGSLVTLQIDGTYLVKHYNLDQDFFLTREFIQENTSWIKQIDSLTYEKENNIFSLIKFMKERRIKKEDALSVIEEAFPSIKFNLTSTGTEPLWNLGVSYTNNISPKH